MHKGDCMRKTIENSILTVYLTGTLDTNNAEDFGQELASYISDDVKTIILDAENLTYISSAGLRQILKFRKAFSQFKIINASLEVYDVFEMSGFTEMMDISKGYRHLSVEGCEKIGEGSNGIVYRISPDEIVKVYKNDDALDDIKREKLLARKALILGVNTAIQKDVVRVGDKYGTIFEMLSAKSLTKLINADADKFDYYIGIYVEMLKQIHAIKVDDPLIPSIKEVEVNRRYDLKGQMDDEHYNKMINLFEEISDDKCLIHGDYHTSNIHYDGKEAILIDMDTLSYGNIIFDFSGIFSAYIGFSLVDKDSVEKFLKIKADVAQRIWQRTVQIYFDVEDITEIENKVKVISYSRILRRTLKREKDNIALIEASRNELYKALDQIDSLNI